MEVRKLNAGDIRRAVSLLSSEMDLIDRVMKREDGEGDDEYKARIGRELLDAIANRHSDDLWAWIADLGQMTPEELDAAPMTAPVDIITAVVEGDDVQGFTEAVRRLVRTFAKKRTG